MAVQTLTKRLTTQDKKRFETLNKKDYKSLSPKEQYEFHTLLGRKYLHYKQTKKHPLSTRTFYKTQGKLQLQRAEKLKKKYKINVF